MAVTAFNHFPEIARALHRELKKTVKEVADSIADDAAIHAPEDTGFLAASIYVKTQTTSTYGKGHVSMTPYQALHRELFPEVDAPPDDLTAYIAVGATYGIYLEMGTRYMPAQPYFYPAMEAGNAYFETLVSFIEGNITAEVGML